MKHSIHILTTFLIALLMGVASPRAVAQAEATDTLTVVATEPEESGKVDVSELIFGHIGDSYEWHFTTIGDTHVSLYLPVIVHSRQSGWHVFSSKHFHHGAEAYEGLYIAQGGEHDGKVVERDAVTGEEVRPTDLSLTKDALALLINSAILIAMVLYCSRWYKRRKVEDEAPRGFVGMMEMMTQMIYNDVIKSNIPQHVQRYAPYLLTAFFFIFLNNLIGLIPGSANLTGNIAVTFVLALCTFLMINVFGNKEYWKDILLPDVPGWLKPIMAVIEIFGMFTKPIALMIRLFANIMAGHTAMLALFSVIFITASMGPVLCGSMSFLSIIFCIFMNCLELLVAFIQAYVFTMLSAVFIGLSQPVHHAE